MGGYFDPAYAYLFNSLNLSQFKGYGVAHVDHPGTTVQIAGAMVIKAVYFFSGEENDIAVDLIKRPEYYISCIVYSFIFFTCICDYLLGFFAYRKLKKISIPLILQLTPFVSPTVYDHIADLSSESFLIPSVLLFISVAFSCASENEIREKNRSIYILLFVLVSGFGLATKLTFFPLMVIPVLLMRKLKSSILYLIGSVAVFLIFVSPAISETNIARFSEWITGIVSHSGQYGTGPKYVIHGESFTQNIFKIFSYELHFDIIYLLLLFAFIMQFIPKIRMKFGNNKYTSLLNGIFIAMTIYIIIISKHFEYHYLIPVYMLCIPALICIYFVSENIISEVNRKKTFTVLCILISIYMIFQLFHLFSEFSYYSERRDETKALEEFREKNYPDIPYITGTISTTEYSLYFGAGYSGKGSNAYTPIINDLYPDYILFNKYGNVFQHPASDSPKDILLRSDKIIFRSDEIELLKPFEEKIKLLLETDKISLKEIYRNKNGEMLYEVIRN
ncbi:MAG: hypothetical protein IPL53_23345 [Ignavibacteria bacterium]|nr:hypothetical protein [Ignavibacteria bacterium]